MKKSDRAHKEDMQAVRRDLVKVLDKLTEDHPGYEFIVVVEMVCPCGFQGMDQLSTAEGHEEHCKMLQRSLERAWEGSPSAVPSGRSMQ